MCQIPEASGRQTVQMVAGTIQILQIACIGEVHILDLIVAAAQLCQVFQIPHVQLRPKPVVGAVQIGHIVEACQSAEGFDPEAGNVDPLHLTYLAVGQHAVAVRVEGGDIVPEGLVREIVLVDGHILRGPADIDLQVGIDPEETGIVTLDQLVLDRAIQRGLIAVKIYVFQVFRTIDIQRCEAGVVAVEVFHSEEVRIQSLKLWTAAHVYRLQLVPPAIQIQQVGVARSVYLGELIVTAVKAHERIQVIQVQRRQLVVAAV